MSFILNLRTFIALWVETHIWPWNRIAEYRRDAEMRGRLLIAATKDLIQARDDLAIMKRDFNDGYSHHFNQWVAKANQLYGARLFDERDLPQMRRFYEEGYNYREASDLLREAFGYGRYGHTFPKDYQKR